jgi:hypothetical protein
MAFGVLNASTSGWICGKVILNAERIWDQPRPLLWDASFRFCGA